MAVKAKRRKVMYQRWLNKNAMKIMCKYCEKCNDCEYRNTKEQAEQEGIITRCTLTPNKGKKVKKAYWEKVNNKGETININKNGIPVNKYFKEEQDNFNHDNQRKPRRSFRRNNHEFKSGK